MSDFLLEPLRPSEFQVNPNRPAYDDPKRAADAAHGALTNEYGLCATYTHITEVHRSDLDGSLDA
jgi:hypothetical protein